MIGIPHNLMYDQSRRLIRTMVLGFFLSAFGIAAVAAERISLCEHWYGDPVWTCGLDMWFRLWR